MQYMEAAFTDSSFEEGQTDMIFVCLGTQIFQMNRLLKQIDQLIEAGEITDPVFAQIGKSDYLPRNYEYRTFLTPEEYQSYVEKADLIVTHGGTGAITKGLRAGKQIIAVPRQYRYREHENDHQLEVVDFFAENGYLLKVMEMDELLPAIRFLKEKPIEKRFVGKGRVCQLVSEYINGNEALKS